MDKQLPLGKLGEAFVEQKLAESGFSVIATNYHSQFGEIDIIAMKDDVIAFVEVKTRKKSGSSALWDITPAKQKKIIKTALLYMQDSNLDLQLSFDVALVSFYKDEFILDYYENAFGI